jgi:hypothetical protein
MISTKAAPFRRSRDLPSAVPRPESGALFVGVAIRCDGRRPSALTGPAEPNLPDARTAKVKNAFARWRPSSGIGLFAVQLGVEPGLLDPGVDFDRGDEIDRPKHAIGADEGPGGGKSDLEHRIESDALRINAQMAGADELASGRAERHGIAEANRNAVVQASDMSCSITIAGTLPSPDEPPLLGTTNFRNAHCVAACSTKDGAA